MAPEVADFVGQLCECARRPVDNLFQVVDRETLAQAGDDGAGCRPARAIGDGRIADRDPGDDRITVMPKARHNGPYSPLSLAIALLLSRSKLTDSGIVSFTLPENSMLLLVIALKFEP